MIISTLNSPLILSLLGKIVIFLTEMWFCGRKPLNLEELTYKLTSLIVIVYSPTHNQCRFVFCIRQPWRRYIYNIEKTACSLYAVFFFIICAVLLKYHAVYNRHYQ